MLYNIPNISNKEDIFRRLKYIYQSCGLNQIQLASLLNVSQAAVSKYLKERIPPADIMLKIAYLGNTTVEWLLTGETQIISDKNLIKDKTGEYKTKYDLNYKIERLDPPVKAALETLIDKLLRKQ